MAISDLTNTKWLFNDSISSYEDVTYHINFTSNSTSFLQLISIEGNYSVHYDSTSVYSRGSWVNETYRTIEITGGTDVTNSALITWLEANATQIVSTTNIILGSDTLVGVDTIKVVDANDSSTYKDFVFNNTPTTTTSIKIGDNTLNGVNTISVTGTDGTQKSFGYFTLPMFIASDHYGNIYGPYEFENGMTFAQWVASAYNTSGWVVSNNQIVLDGFKILRTSPSFSSSTYVAPTDLVEAKEYGVLVNN